MVGALFEEALTIGLSSKDVELKGLPIDVFIFFDIHSFFWGGGPIIVWHPIYFVFERKLAVKVRPLKIA